jgi:hypothetical protein
MPSSYLIFDFGEDEEAVQQARHKVESWKQGFRLGDKLAIKFEREHPDTEASESAEEGVKGDAEGSDARKESSKPAPGKHASSARDHSAEGKQSRKKKSSAKSSESSATDDEQNAGGKVRLIVRLNFSDHEKLSLQRWLDRIPTEEPFKSLHPKIVRHPDPDFRETDQLFETLS